MHIGNIYALPTLLMIYPGADTDAGAVVLVPVRINSNLKTMTVEEFLGQKKQMHVTAFRHLVFDELPHDLHRIAEEGNAAARLEVDLRKESEGRVYTVDDFIKAIADDVKKTLRRHEHLDHERCAPNTSPPRVEEQSCIAHS